MTNKFKTLSKILTIVLRILLGKKAQDINANDNIAVPQTCAGETTYPLSKIRNSEVNNTKAIDILDIDLNTLFTIILSLKFNPFWDISSSNLLFIVKRYPSFLGGL